MAELLTALDSNGLEQFDDPALLEFMQDFERMRNVMSSIDHRLVTACQTRGWPTPQLRAPSPACSWPPCGCRQLKHCVG